MNSSNGYNPRDWCVSGDYLLLERAFQEVADEGADDEDDHEDDDADEDANHAPSEEDEPACDRAEITAHEESDEPEDNADDNAVDRALLEQPPAIFLTWLRVPVDQPNNKGQQFQPHFFFHLLA